MAYPSIGQIVDCELYGTKGLQATVINESETQLYLRSRTGKDEFDWETRLGEVLQIQFRSSSGALCIASSRIAAIEEDGADDVIVIERPHEEAIQKIQQREYVRVGVSVEIQCTCLMNENEGLRTIKAITHDLSAGGLSFYLEDEPCLTLGTSVSLKLFLRTRDGLQMIDAQGDLVRIEQIGRAIPLYAVRLVDLKDKEQRQILQFVYRKQLEGRGKKS